MSRPVPTESGPWWRMLDGGDRDIVDVYFTNSGGWWDYADGRANGEVTDDGHWLAPCLPPESAAELSRLRAMRDEIAAYVDSTEPGADARAWLATPAACRPVRVPGKPFHAEALPSVIVLVDDLRAILTRSEP